MPDWLIFIYIVQQVTI